VANAPDLTLVRDLDGDDRADEYIRIYTDLGNLEHGLHGLNWAPDGKLYMSKGNSKGHNRPEEDGRVAPRAFRELFGLASPEGAPDLPPPVRFTAENYYTEGRGYHDPSDDWGRQGGVLRCGPLGRNPEIVARGFRNPWGIAFDEEFCWLGTDNGQDQGNLVARRIGSGFPILWTEGDEHSAPFVKGHGTRIVNHGLVRKQFYREAGWHSWCARGRRPTTSGDIRSTIFLAA
jgi:hypothetical protein